MATNMNLLTGSLLSLFNDSSVIPRPYSGYSGSFFWGANQEIIWRDNMPKGKVWPGEDSNSQWTFGTGGKRSKIYNIQVDLFTTHGFTDTQGNKNAELLNRYLELIEDAVMDNRSYGPVQLQDASTTMQPQRADEIANNVWMARKVLVFTERK